MKISILGSAKDFKMYWKNYLFQSFLATFTLFVVLLYLSLRDAVIIASIGATAFIVFAMPSNLTAQPRNVIGGHIIGLICGSLCAFIPKTLFLPYIFVHSLAVGLSIFLMLITDTEHPPASGTALGVTMKGFSLNVTVTVIVSVIVLSLAHHYLRRFLRDLT